MEIIIMGQPVAKQANKINGKGKFIRQYSSQKKEEARYETEIKAQCIGHTPFTGALRIDYEFISARPKSHFRTGKHSHILRDDAPVYWVVKKNDLDNMLKFVNDRCSNKFETRNKKKILIQEMVWVDDCQWIRGYIEKRYCFHNEPPQTILMIWEI